MKKKKRCFALFSGGLDSMLSVLHMKNLGYEVLPIFFSTPFFGSENAQKAAEEIGYHLIIYDITDKHIKMLQNPRYGYGKYMNPCIDCHGLMFREAAELMKQYKTDFLISGEVLGQRPMSQRKDALNSVGKLSNIKDLIVRPLSQKLLADTLPIREEWVDKEKMLDIQGRSRKRQMEMANDLGLKTFQTPAGGCLLTDESFSLRLRDLIEHNMLELNFIEFLKIGRHFRLNDDVKVIIGRKDKENEMIANLAKNELILKTNNIPGPLGVINSKRNPNEEEIRFAASILLRYNNKAQNRAEVVFGKKFQLTNKIEVQKIEPDILMKMRI